MKLVENYFNAGNVYGKQVCSCIADMLVEKDAKTLMFMGEDAIYKSEVSVKKVAELFEKAGVDYTFGALNTSGSSLYFLVGQTAETLAQAKKFADYVNKYETVVIYDPVDLSFILHELKEWGIEITAKVIGFNEFVLSLIEDGKITVKKSDKEYTLQDNFAYARELDDPNFGRAIIEKVGVVKDMLLIRKEANLAGNLIMNEYMPSVIKTVALNRWDNVEGMECTTVVTENPAEYEMLKATCPEGKTVLSIEEMILENLA
jgi:Fe-S oxidoreductase